VLTTLDAKELAEMEAQYSQQCLGLTWAAVGCGVAAFGAEFVEWNLQRFTPKGETVNARWKARGVPWIGNGTSGRSSNRFRMWQVQA